MRRRVVLLAGTCLLLLFVKVLASRAISPDIVRKIERIGPFGGEVRSLLMDRNNPENVFLGTSDGLLYGSADGGKSWSLIRPGIRKPQFVIDALVQHPRDRNHFYAGAWDLDSDGGGLFESVDRGMSWREVALPHAAPAVRDVVISKADPAQILVGALEGAYLSRDGGTTWKQLPFGAPDLPKIESVAIDPGDPRILYLGTWRLPYRSINSGKSWQQIQTGILLDSDVFSICPDPRKRDVVYASACTGIYRSDNKGLSWTRLKVMPASYGVRAHFVYVDPTDSNRIFGGTTEGLFISNNAGQTWRRSTPANLTVNAIQVDPRNGRRILIGCENEGVLRSEDGGVNWSPSNAGFVHRQVSQIIADSRLPGRLYVKVLPERAGSSLLEYDRRRNRWEQAAVNLESGIKIHSYLSLPGSRGVLAGTSEGVYQREALGTRQWRKLAGNIGRVAVYDLVLNVSRSEILAGTSDGIFRSRLNPIAFQKTERMRLSTAVSSIQISKSNSALLYAASDLGVIRSVDHGNSWTVASSGLPFRAKVLALAICTSDENHVFAGTSSGLFETRDGGRSWRGTADGRLTVAVPSVLVLDERGERIMAADNSVGGVFLSLDGGRRWDRLVESDLESPVSSLVRDPQEPSEIYVGTRSQGVYRLSLNTDRISAESR